MKQVIISIILTLTMLLTSCSSCNPFARKDPDPDGSTIVDLESSNTGSDSSKTTQLDPGKPGQDSSKDDSYKGGGRVGGGQGSGSVDGSGNDSSKKDDSSKNDSKTESSKPEDSKSESSKPESSKPESSESSSEASSTPELSENEKALAAAKVMIESTWYAHDELVMALESQGFSNSASKYGADNCGADWKEMAVRAANWFADGSLLSPDDLRASLTTALFKSDEVDYAMANNSIDWAKMAKDYAQWQLEDYIWSQGSLGNHMVGEGFTNADVLSAFSSITYDRWTQEAKEEAASIFFTQTYQTLVEDVQAVGFDLTQAGIAADSVKDWDSAALADATDYEAANQTCTYMSLYYYLNDNTGFGCGYSDPQTTKAISSLAVDWNIHAVNKANELLISEGILVSEYEMTAELEYYGFSTSEAAYGAANCCGNTESVYWEIAKLLGRDYILNTGNPPAALYAYLVYDHYFTAEQEAYAENHWNDGAEFACANYLYEDPLITRDAMMAKLKADGYSDIEASEACYSNGLY